MNSYKTIDECLATYPKEVFDILQEIRNIIKKAAPKANEAIKYGIPTFVLNGRNLIHFAGYKNHIGLYPGSHAIEVFKSELSDYKTSKGTIQFPLDKRINYDLIKKITKFRIDEEAKNK